MASDKNFIFNNTHRELDLLIFVHPGENDVCSSHAPIGGEAQPHVPQGGNLQAKQDQRALIWIYTHCIYSLQSQIIRSTIREQSVYTKVLTQLENKVNAQMYRLN